MKNKYKILLIVGVILFSGCSVKSKKGLVMSKLEKASKLSTVKVTVSKNVYSKEDKKLWKDRYFLARTEATIKFGIDLSKIQSKDIHIRGDRISIKLPPVEITNFSYPAEKFFIDTIITDMDNKKIEIEKVEELYRTAELQIRETIELLNIKRSAISKTERIVRHMCHYMGFGAVDINIDTTNSRMFNNLN